VATMETQTKVTLQSGKVLVLNESELDELKELFDADTTIPNNIPMRNGLLTQDEIDLMLSPDGIIPYQRFKEHLFDHDDLGLEIESRPREEIISKYETMLSNTSKSNFVGEDPSDLSTFRFGGSRSPVI